MGIVRTAVQSPVVLRGEAPSLICLHKAPLIYLGRRPGGLRVLANLEAGGTTLLAAFGVGTAAGHVKYRGGRPGGNISWHSSYLCRWPNCTLQAAVSSGGGKSLKQTTGGQPLGMGSAGATMGLLQDFIQR
jgi:hypothetical protein